MKHRILFVSLIAIVAVVSLAIGSAAIPTEDPKPEAKPIAKHSMLPDTCFVSIHVYETRDDPETPEVVTFVLELKPDHQDGNEVAWGVDEVKVILRHDSGAQDDETFIDSSPTVATGDGLWTVEHDDPNAPTIEEFAQSPLISGHAVGPSSKELDYRANLNGQLGGGQHSARRSMYFVAVGFGYCIANAICEECHSCCTQPCEADDEPAEIDGDDEY
jgi:hypothetical protein